MNDGVWVWGDGVTSFLRTWMIQPVGSRHAWWSDNLFRLGMVFCHNILLLESLLDVVLLSTAWTKILSCSQVLCKKFTEAWFSKTAKNEYCWIDCMFDSFFMDGGDSAFPCLGSLGRTRKGQLNKSRWSFFVGRTRQDQYENLLRPSTSPR